MKNFGIIKSIVANLICKSIVIGQMEGKISQYDLNEMANECTDKILKEE